MPSEDRAAERAGHAERVARPRAARQPGRERVERLERRPARERHRGQDRERERPGRREVARADGDGLASRGGCAALGDRVAVLKTDTIVDGVDVRLAECGAEAAGRKAVAVCASDLAREGVVLVRIGTVTAAASGLRLLRGGKAEPLPRGGYDHLRG